MKCPYCVKICNKCKRLLVANKANFYKEKRGKYGLGSKCKECKKKYDKEKNKEYYENNKEYRKEYDKQHYENNKEHIKERNRQWREDNSEHLKQYNKEWYKDNKDNVKEYNKQYRQDNSEHLKEHYKQYHKDNPQVRFNNTNKHRSREEQGIGITKEQWLDMMNYFEWRCAYSRETLSKDTRSIDHIIPLAKGGLNEIWNCAPMLKSYNRSKQTSDINEWYLAQDFYSEERLNKIYEWQEYAYNKYYEE